MSVVGTHEYLAPKIIRGDEHGSAIDWWASTPLHDKQVLMTQIRLPTLM